MQLPQKGQLSQRVRSPPAKVNQRNEGTPGGLQLCTLRSVGRNEKYPVAFFQERTDQAEPEIVEVPGGIRNDGYGDGWLADIKFA